MPRVLIPYVISDDDKIEECGYDSILMNLHEVHEMMRREVHGHAEGDAGRGDAESGAEPEGGR